MNELFYLQDSRSNVGDALLFWALGGGYTSNLYRAEAFTRESAIGQHKCRETDVPWPKTYVDHRSHRGVDCQYVDPEAAALAAESEQRFYAACPRDWNGNDLLWVALGAGNTPDLNQAKVFSLGHVPGLCARGFQPLPAFYIDGKARRLVHAQNVSIKQALRGTGIKLIKPKKPRAYVYRCEPCGRFLTQRQNYEECPNCGAENRP